MINKEQIAEYRKSYQESFPNAIVSDIELCAQYQLAKVQEVFGLVDLYGKDTTKEMFPDKYKIYEEANKQNKESI